MLRITSGKYKNLVLYQPPDSITRPISQKVRAAVFNSLADKIIGASVLDIYAGSGAMSIEAISRGASKSVLVDSNSKAIFSIKRNIDKLVSSSNMTVMKRDALQFIIDCHEKYDVIILDPPYDNFDVNIVNRVANLLQYGGIIVVSHSSKIHIDGLNDNLRIVSSKHYGDTQIEYIDALN
jgi:16S rRNA (guanine966-N2)-methyltransferase